MDIYFLGAGASLADGVPLQEDLLKEIFENSDETIKKVKGTKEVLEFIEASFFTRNKFYPTFEQVFSLIDYYIRNKRSAGGSLTVSKLVRFRSTLTNLIYCAIFRYDTDKPKNYSKFIKKLSSKKKIAILTMNYDALIDKALASKKLKFSYCIDCNSIDSEKKTTSTNGTIPLIKIHGSTNWRYCDCCGKVSISDKNPFDREDSRKLNLCNTDKTVLQPLLLTPSYEKNFSNPIFTNLHKVAEDCLRKAETINIIGYSFPYSDIHIHALMLRALPKNALIRVINPAPSDSLKTYIRIISDMAGGEGKAPQFKRVTFEEWLM